MLKGKHGVSACSLSSCRIRAEALARAFNTRIWPCVWVSRGSSAERDDGMSNGIDDEEEFFDASPSPIEVEDGAVYCQQHSSAATEAGRAKLYELLQQHVTDDAIDVFYDVSEDSVLTDTSNDTCLKDDLKDSAQVEGFCQSSECCKLLDAEHNFSNNTNRVPEDVKRDELMISNGNQSIDKIQYSAAIQMSNGDESDISQTVSDPSDSCSSCYDDNLALCINKEITSSDKSISNLTNINNIILQENKTENKWEEILLNANEEHLNYGKPTNEDIIPEGSDIIMVKNKIKKEVSHEIELTCDDKCSSDTEHEHLGIVKQFTEKDEEVISENPTETIMPSLDSNNKSIYHGENSVSNEKEHFNDIQETSEDVKNLKVFEGDRIEVEVSEASSASPSSDSSSSKTVSPTSSRLRVFEEARPKIARTTSLKTGKTPPGTPSRKKIVRFADVLGLDLEDVRHIIIGDMPIIPSSAYTDLDLKDVDLPACEPISETVEIRSRQSACWNSLPTAAASNVLYPTFAIPGEQPDFLDKVRHQGICLDTVIVSDMNVQCTCRVMNYGYHKRVVARYTFNDWLSYNDIDASYIQGSSNGETDSFGFSIFFSPQNKNVKFALKFAVNGKEYWDSNRGQNYCLNYHDPVQNVSSPVWQHQFW